MSEGDKYMEEVIQPGDEASKFCHQISIDSYRNNKIIEVIPRQPGNFRGAVNHRWRRDILEAMIEGRLEETSGMDGAGGKTQFAPLLPLENHFYWLGWEVPAMVFDDRARRGDKAVYCLNQVDVKLLTTKNLPYFKAAFMGFGQALKEQKMINLGGEVGVMRFSITAFSDTGEEIELIFTWTGACVGLSSPELRFDQREVKPSYPIVGFYEPGHRCNGSHYLIDLLRLRFGTNIKEMIKNLEARDFIKLMMRPSTIYSRTLNRITGWNPDGTIGKPLARIVRGAHITGGGVWNKLGEELPPGIGAVLNRMPELPRVLQKAQIYSMGTELELSGKKGYSTFHGGCGMMLICETKEDADIVIGEARKDGIEASEIGQTIESRRNEIAILSKYIKEEMLSSLL